MENKLSKEKVTEEEYDDNKELISQPLVNEGEVCKNEVENKRPEKKSFKETIKLLKPGKGYFITPIIIYLNVFVFIVMVFNGVSLFDPTVESLVQWGGNFRSITLSGQPWRLITNVFVHAGIIHLLFNMYAFLYIGGLLEEKFGSHRYIFAYLATGVFASIASISINENIVSVGASGAIFGMYGVFLALLIAKAVSIPDESRKSLISSILFFIGYNLFFGLTREGIDNAAHVGGLVSGFVIGFLYVPSLKQTKYTRRVTIGIAVVILVAAFVTPKLISNKLGEFQIAMEEFSKTEQHALWMYREDFTDLPEDKVQLYYDKFRNEGIDLWNANLELLNGLNNMPDYIKERINILKEYCNLRIKSCETMQYLIRYNKASDEKKLKDINLEIEKIITKLQMMSE